MSESTMSESKRDKDIALNWRGPLLAAGIFALVFAILLIMAHQNESKTSDMGSSLREDPYGTSLLFDSYRRDGYQVNRSQDEDSLVDQDASRTTAFFIGSSGFPEWRINDRNLQNGAKFSKRLEDFLARGGRVVLINPRWELKSESQGWQVANNWARAVPERSAQEQPVQKPREHTSPWISPVATSMPADSENMYLGDDGPWLETDAHWVALYKGGAEGNTADTPAHVYMAMRRAGNGELIAASQESFLLNEAIKLRPNPVLLDFLAGGRPVIWVDETLHGLHQDEGVLWLVHRYRLQSALLLFWATLLVLLWSLSGDLVRSPARGPSTQIIRQGEVAGVAARRLLQRSVAKESVVAECWEQFRRCWPQDAEAISADPISGARLRTALAQSPLAGYRELSQLVAERRASATGLGGVFRNAPDSPMRKR